MYLVVFGGGNEAPSYALKGDFESAKKQAEKWVEEMEEGDWVDVLKINLYNNTIERVEL